MKQSFFTVAIVILWLVPTAARATLKAGAARVDVTPIRLPVLVNGGMLSRSVENVSTRLYARAIVLDDGQQRLGIVVVDSCMMSRSLLDEAKQLAAQRTSILPDRMLISATHTHTAPASMGCLGTNADPTYVPYLREKLAEALAAAHLVAASEFAQQERLDALLEARRREAEREAERVRLREEEPQRREEAMTTPGPTTTIPWDTDPHPDGPSDVQWEALRFCEATGNYEAVSPTGKYRGAYQFSRQTWDWIAGMYHENLVGVDPAAASPYDQDHMAQALYDLRGRGQWPVCGRYLP